MHTKVRDGELIGYSRLFSLSRDGSDLKMLSTRHRDRSLAMQETRVEYVEYQGLDHYLDDDSARSDMLVKADGFLRAAIGM
jgi:hypothetical protein